MPRPITALQSVRLRLTILRVTMLQAAVVLSGLRGTAATPLPHVEGTLSGPSSLFGGDGTAG